MESDEQWRAISYTLHRAQTEHKAGAEDVAEMGAWHWRNKRRYEFGRLLVSRSGMGHRGRATWGRPNAIFWDAFAIAGYRCRGARPI